MLFCHSLASGQNLHVPEGTNLQETHLPPDTAEFLTSRKALTAPILHLRFGASPAVLQASPEAGLPCSPLRAKSRGLARAGDASNISTN